MLRIPAWLCSLLYEFPAEAGIHPKIVSERLGHASVAITLDTYSHVLPGLQEAAAECFDMLLQSRQAEVEDVGKNVGKEWGV